MKSGVIITPANPQLEGNTKTNDLHLKVISFNGAKQPLLNRHIQNYWEYTCQHTNHSPTGYHQ
jgi:hypothetical protein